MVYRRLDQDGDYSFGGGKQDFTTDLNAVSQAIKTKLRLLKGEWWEKIDEGLPLFQNILGLRGTEENIRAVDLLIQDRILSTPNTTGIQNYKSIIDSKSRKYTFTCTVSTFYGPVTVEEAF